MSFSFRLTQPVWGPKSSVSELSRASKMAAGIPNPLQSPAQSEVDHPPTSAPSPQLQSPTAPAAAPRLRTSLEPYCKDFMAMALTDEYAALVATSDNLPGPQMQRTETHTFLSWTCASLAASYCNRMKIPSKCRLTLASSVAHCGLLGWLGSGCRTKDHRAH